MKKKTIKKTTGDRVSINIDRKIYKKLAKQKIDYDFGTWDKFMAALSGIVNQFKPELEDLK